MAVSQRDALIAGLREKQGSRTQVEFASVLGITQQYLSMLYCGTKTVGLPLARTIVELYPEMEATVTAHLLARPEGDRDPAATEAAG